MVVKECSLVTVFHELPFLFLPDRNGLEIVRTSFYRGESPDESTDMSFFMPSENWSKSHRFVCRFFCRPKTGKKVIGLYVVFFAVGKLGKKS